MPTVTKSSYSLRQFASSSDKDFVEALALYVRYTPPAVRTSTNEITYWVDNAAAYDEDRFLVVGFYCGKRLIGFSEMAYLSSSKVLAIDYLVIEPDYRKNNVFFEFIEHAKSFVAELGLEVLYIVAEIGKFGANAPPDNGRAMVRLLKFAGFKVAKALYYQPQLGEKNADSEMEAILMVYLYGDTDGAGKQSRIAKATYLQIIGSVYFDHYLRWYQPHVDDADAYKKGLAKLLKKIETSIKKDFVELNGHHILLETGAAETASKDKQLTLASALTLGVIVIAVASLIGLLQFSSVSVGSLALIYLVVFVSLVGIMASYRESPTVIFREALRLLGKAFRTRG